MTETAKVSTFATEMHCKADFYNLDHRDRLGDDFHDELKQSIASFTWHLLQLKSDSLMVPAVWRPVGVIAHDERLLVH